MNSLSAIPAAAGAILLSTRQKLDVRIERDGRVTFRRRPGDDVRVEMSRATWEAMGRPSAVRATVEPIDQEHRGA